MKNVSAGLLILMLGFCFAAALTSGVDYQAATVTTYSAPR